MKKNSTLSLICTLLFLVGIIASFLGLLNQGNKLLSYILLAVSVIYLLGGWYLFRGYHAEGHPLLLFLMGYLYAGIFVAFTFVTAEWPLNKTFISIAIAWAVIQIIMVTVIRKKLDKDKFAQLIIEGCLMLVMTVAELIYLL